MAIPPLGCPRSTRLAVRAEAAENFGETWRKVLEKILAALADVIPRADIVPAHNSITPGACSRGALRTDLLHDWTPIPFVVSDALRGRTTAAGYNAPMTHFRNRRCLASCRRRLGRASRAQARGGSLLHRVPNRPPRFPTSTPPPGPSAHPSGFSIRSQRGSALAFGSAIPSAFRPRPSKQSFSAATHRFQPNGFQDSRSYLRRHGAQFRRALILSHIWPDNASGCE